MRLLKEGQDVSKRIIDYEYLSDEDIENILVSRDEYAKRKFVRHEDVKWG